MRVVLLSQALMLVGSMSLAEAQDQTERGASSLPEITVIGTSRRDESLNVTPGVSAAPTPDSMDIIARLPGANINRNGPLSGQAQYRGLFGPRLSVRVDGMRVTPGGLNWMDSPMHYMPPGLTNNVTLTRGIAPVSSGPGIGGLIEANSKRGDFISSDEIGTTGDFTASVMSNDGTAVSGMFGLANDANRVHLIGSREEGDDTEFGGGTIGATEFERTTYGGGYGFRWGDSALSLDYTHTDTDLTGTPALPLDIDFFDTDRFNLGLDTELGRVRVSTQVFYTDVEHAMNNYLLREPQDISSLPLPPFQDEERRFVEVESDALGFFLKAETDWGGGTFAAGLDGNFAEHSGVVRDPDFEPFFVQNFENAADDYVGAFVEWVGDLATDWTLEAGLRYNRVETDADAVEAQPAQLCDSGQFPPGTPPCAVAALRDRFNESDRKQANNNIDVVLKLDYQISPDLIASFGYGRKTRSPSYIERYLWIPLEVNSGLGDLNNYVGDINLDPEVSNQFEAGLQWQFSRGYFTPRIFYRIIDDYIQGVASTDPIVIAVSGQANGDPTPLVFANTEAEFYGIDAQFRYDLSERLIFDATLNYVRGKNKDLNDDLYRIAPLNGRLALTYARSSSSVTVESVLSAEQDKISRTIVLDETRSSNEPISGYGIVNLYGELLLRGGIQIRAGVENLFDKDYTNPLAGFNRVVNSDVPLGVQLPGPGVNWFAQVSYAW